MVVKVQALKKWLTLLSTRSVMSLLVHFQCLTKLMLVKEAHNSGNSFMATQLEETDYVFYTVAPVANIMIVD